jgi:uncharacterized protein YjdB
MKYSVNLIMAGALICAACFASCKDDDGGGDASVQSVTPSQNTVYILQGATTTVAATVAPDAAGQEINWTSADPNIVAIAGREMIGGISTVSITGVSLGSTTITAASAGSPDKKANIQVTVGTRIDSVAADIDRAILVLGANETVAVEASVIPATAIQTLEWTSSNTAVATVTNGVIRAAGTGTAIIAAVSTDDPTKRATVAVEVVSLVNKVIHITSKFGNGLTVSWVNLGGDLVEFFYTNEAGRPASLIQPVTTQSSYIPDFGSAPLSYRTLYFTQGEDRDTLAAPMVDFTGSIYDLTQYVRSSPAETEIKACDFDIGGEGIGFHDADNNNALHNYRRDRGDTRSDAAGINTDLCIGWIHSGMWYNYTVVVLDEGWYDIDFSVSVGGSGARCRIEVDGEPSEEYPMNSNGSWADWRYYCDFYRIEPPRFYLTAGKHVIKLFSTSNNFNFNGLKLTYKP